MNDFPLIKSLGIVVIPISRGFLSGEYIRASDLEALLAKGVRVQVVRIREGDSWYASDAGCIGKTHTGLLIDIRPIEKPDTAESLLKECIRLEEQYRGPGEFFIDPSDCSAFGKLMERARKVLASRQEAGDK